MLLLKQCGHGDGTDIDGHSSFRLLHGRERFLMLHIEDMPGFEAAPQDGFSCGAASIYLLSSGLYRRLRSFTARVLLRFADYTAGQEFHLATKMLN